MKLSRVLAAAVLSTSLLAFHAASAAPIVTGTVTGNAGAWTHTFTIENNLGGTNGIYFFGVLMPNGVELSGPTGWSSADHPTWQTTNGGSGTVYNNVWIDMNLGDKIAPGFSGTFTVLETALTAQSNIQWFAYAAGGTYNGNDHFNPPYNPGFEGIVGQAATAVPEPGVWALMILGMGAVGATMRRSRKQAVAVRYA